MTSNLQTIDVPHESPVREAFKFSSLRLFKNTAIKNAATKSQAKREELLDQLKKATKRLMEEAAVRNSVSENSCLVFEFCGHVESCLQYGLSNISRSFSRDSTTADLLPKLSPLSVEASTLQNLLKRNEKSGFNHGNMPNVSHISLYRNAIGSPSLFKRSSSYKINVNRSAWIHIALTEKLLYKIVESIICEGKFWYQPEAIIGNEVDSTTLLSLIAGPCAISYVCPTVEDPSWSALHADELVERHRFISRSTSDRVCTTRKTHSRRLDFLLRSTGDDLWSKEIRMVQTNSPLRPAVQSPSQSSTCSISPNSCGEVDSLYQPRRHTLLFAKNNVGLGDSTSILGYLAVYNNATGVTIRWTSNELLLQASGQSLQPSNRDCHAGSHCGSCSATDFNPQSANVRPTSLLPDEGTVEQKEDGPNLLQDTVNCQHSDDTPTSVLHKPQHPMVVNIHAENCEYIHCHSDSQGMRLVFVGSDGVQYPTLRLPGNRRAAFELLTSLEQGMLTFAELQPSPANICDLQVDKTDHCDVNQALSTSSVLQRTAIDSTSQSSANGENPLKKLMYFCHLKSFPSDTHKQNRPEQECQCVNAVHETGNPSISSIDQNLGTTEMATVTTHTISSNDPKIINTTKPNGVSDLLFKIIREPVSKAQLESGTKVTEGLVRQPMCQKPRFSNSRQPISSLSNSVDSIKLTLLANLFYAWLAHCRYMKLVNTHLSGLVIHSSACYDQTDSSWEALNSKTWAERYTSLSEEEKMHFDPTQIYQQIYHSGCDPTIRTQVWPYLLGLFKWSMTDMEKQDHMNKLSQHYWSKQAEWMSLQQSLEENKDYESVSLTPLSSESDFIVGDTTQSIVTCGSNKVECENHILAQFGHVLETVQKDVVRCDRNNELFSKFENHGETNLALLRRVLLTYIWENLDDGYTQGMCDVIAPILALVTADSGLTTEAVEVTTYAYFRHLLQMRLGKLFTYAESSTLMDENFSSLRALVHVMDHELTEHMQACGEFSHFYFCYRWFLLDFKREFNYLDIFRVWETLLAAMHHISSRFEMFVALALIQSYRDVIINTRMEFTDILKFFNERAEKHNVEDILSLARKFAQEIQCLSYRSDV
ncbi:hypothetical protein PHET_02955 [Paragonimus heterotremus]|uniref:Rab-GAP TBC domain-containing protein n=1 Tax=Paragonimus heterotremus TaxID=100268 RepID=A0A8J4WJJ7_9TREM|nr:hypothetical protein PHET_02955 [Paragonimus heterotremus]